MKGTKVSAKTLIGGYALLWTIVQGLETDIAKEVFKELTGKVPAQIVAEFFADFKERLESANSEKEKIELEKITSEEAPKELAKVLAYVSAYALAAPRERLEQLPVSEKTAFELTDAQAEMFESCIADSAISSVEIEQHDLPPIPRNEFPVRAIRPKKPDPEPEEHEEWMISIETIIVTSPNLEEEDQRTRQWKGKTSNDRKVLFTVEDRQFWERLHHKEFSFSENTKIVGQVATRFLSGKPKQSKIVKVIKFDGAEISQPIDENGLKAIVGDLNSNSRDDGFGSLLGY